MDERIEKAFSVANYMATLTNQRRIILEEYNQSLLYYINGGTFKITPELINFVKTVIDLGYTSDVPLLDSNNLPIVISDVTDFFNKIVEIHFQTLNDYAVKHADLKSKRKIGDIVQI